jgi:molecular chaperone GrpE
VDSDVPQPEAGKEALCDQAEAVEAAEDKAVGEKEAEEKSAEEEAEQKTAEAEEADRAQEPEVTDKQREIEEWIARYTRLRADFDNYRRRSRQQLEEYSQRGAERLIIKLLPVLDDLDRALEAAANSGSTEGLAQGVSMVRQALLDALHSEGLSQVESVGSVFDPHCHEAVAREECAEGELYVVEEYQKGYSLAGRLLRPAKVKVGPAPENPTN